MNGRWLIVVLVLGSTMVRAAPIHGVAEWVPKTVLQLPDTLRTKMLAAIARGDLAGAIALWELETGRTAPNWLQAFQIAFSTDNQRAGPCIQVAKSVYAGFKRLGANPSYVRFTAMGSEWGDEFIAFDRRAGEPLSAIRISENALHYAVQLENRIYDAMTGPSGLLVTEYMKRLNSPSGITMQSVSQLP